MSTEVNRFYGFQPELLVSDHMQVVAKTLDVLADPARAEVAAVYLWTAYDLAIGDTASDSIIDRLGSQATSGCMHALALKALRSAGAIYGENALSDGGREALQQYIGEVEQ